MIRYALVCEQGHDFESWFASSEAFERQSSSSLLSCPLCGSAKVEKALMAPRVTRTDRGASRGESAPTTPSAPAGEAESKPAPSGQPAPVAIMSDQEREFRKKLHELREHLTRNSDYVGGKFPEEARRMHYGEIEHRSIYGEATPSEAAALHEEGIEFHPLPVIPEDRN